MKHIHIPGDPELTRIANSLGVKQVSVFLTGVEDGFDQGAEPAVVMQYDEPVLQWEYETGCQVGACLAARDRSLH
jgi:hydroxyethylthiazole kinase-like sugar kinase family protein